MIMFLLCFLFLMLFYYLKIILGTYVVMSSTFKMGQGVKLPMVVDFTYWVPFGLISFISCFRWWSSCFRRPEWGRVYLGIFCDFILVKLISALAQFLLKIDEFLLIWNTIIVCETYVVKQDYFSLVIIVDMLV